jgi:subtilase family serine protease
MRNIKAMGGLVCAALLASACGSNGSGESSGTSSQAVSAQPTVVNYRNVRGVRKAPGGAGSAPTDATCRASYGGPCYSPQEMQAGYGLSALLADGIDGAGQTIVIVDSYGSPTIEADLKQFDADYGLADPPSFQVLSPLGTVAFDPTSSDMQGWAFETTLDVEWAHSMAPGASIVLLTSPVSETEGVTGMPQMLSLETYALDHKLGSIISQSWGATENTLFDAAGKQVLADFEAMYTRARREHVTVFASAGDNGTANQEVDGVTFYSFPTVIYPGSSPNVTSVGGTSLTLDTTGKYESEVVWNNADGAGGGGISQYFAQPSWQALLPRSDQRIVNGHRAIPDVAYNADPATTILIYISIPGLEPGYYGIGGTSEGSPQWAGLAADFNQLAGRPLGYLNDKLYLLGAVGALKPFFHDITVGNNAFDGLTGYSATTGWDPATGWGTPALADLGKLLADLPDEE